jgi:UDP:flavonoid glycosyltransferase YjiC (YdhE family)
VLHWDFSASAPLALYSWPHETSPEALARTVGGRQIVREFREPMMPIVQSYADRNRLEIDWSNPAVTVSKLAVITQTPKAFDFPIPHPPPQFYYAGPFHDNEGREPVPFPWEKLTGKPLIYASMGTLVNELLKLNPSQESPGWGEQRILCESRQTGFNFCKFRTKLKYR